jgi:glycosyltransferase involved in cell wall biosynthesis
MLALALGIAQHVRWLGVLPPESVARELRASRALIQFSHTTPAGDREGTPVAMLEAMSCGLPVIGSRHAGIPDVLEQGVHGLLVDPFDLPALTAAMGRLAREPELAASLGRAAAALIRSQYTQERYIRQLSALIQTALPQPAVP